MRDTTTPEGVHQPTTGLRSGGPGSVVPWDSLGLPGAEVHRPRPVAGRHREVDAPPGRGADPGLRRARVRPPTPSPERRSRSRTSSVPAASSARTCWWSPRPAAAGSTPPWWTRFEYLTGGDAATVAIQYSYLPSWISYLVDQSKAREAGRALFDAVYDPWSKLPPDQRPRLFVAGESLGSFGGETAFSGEYDLRNRTTGDVVRRPTQLQHAVPRVQRPPRPRQPGDPAGLQGRPHRPVHQRPRGRDPSAGPARGTAAGSCT